MTGHLQRGKSGTDWEWPARWHGTVSVRVPASTMWDVTSVDRGSIVFRRFGLSHRARSFMALTPRRRGWVWRYLRYFRLR
jgi:hypothetical protein